MQCLWIPEENTGPLGAGVTRDCELSDLGVRTELVSSARTCTLYMSYLQLPVFNVIGAQLRDFGLLQCQKF